MLNPVIQGHFEGGCVVLRDDVEHRNWVKFLGQQAPWSPSRDNAQLAWKNWIRRKEMKLVILDGLSDWEIVEEILKDSGNQIRILLTTSEEEISEAQKTWQRLGEIRIVQLKDFNPEEQTRFGSLWSSYTNCQ